MKELLVYTALRLLLLLASFAIVAGLWIAVTGGVSVFWCLVIAFVISGIGSYYVLNPQREAFARRVEERASRASARFDEMKAREDRD
ncbi:hypothetical protein ENKNEFLB_04143 [Nocardioides aquaticus]|uniref:DUF4229 domain-containing protein n=1 Tax=Nocardioides aquaticus TaxID=160826 RepID=A0ABX8EMK0_9ACTN|nr:DUF4229 domain-containing protein [Nocardioides aquaticus]QVT81726.1 hypothetical protein ENKNEFLB_04143 [Nocardioides aquaticus]